MPRLVTLFEDENRIVQFDTYTRSFIVRDPSDNDWIMSERYPDKLIAYLLLYTILSKEDVLSIFNSLIDVVYDKVLPQ